jgi:hypothetical protein
MRSEASHKPQVIDTTNPRHVAWWAAELGVSEGSLLDMVDIVGNQARVVEYYLGLREAREQRQPAGPANESVALTS